MNLDLSPVVRRESYGCPRSTKGFTLIELMVAITLGILISIGLVTLFGATSKTNRVQDAMAQMQENGRYAISVMNADLRLIGRQPISMSGYASADSVFGTNGVVSQVLAPQVYVDKIHFPDGDIGQPTGWDTGNLITWWPLSPRYFVQGYECSTGTCTPSEPPTKAAPATGTTAAGQRVSKSDVLTVRYFNTEGWSYLNGEVVTACNVANNTLSTVTLTPHTATDPKSEAFNFKTGDLAMLTSGGFSEIFEVGVAGSVLTPQDIHNVASGNGIPCVGGTTNTPLEITLFNFSRDFISATYSLQLEADNNDSKRFIPTLVRRLSNNITVASAADDQPLVQGVEQMDFLYGVQATDGKVSYMDANELTTTTSILCSPAPAQYAPTNIAAGTLEPACLWRSVKNIELHILVDSVNNMFDLAPADMAYHYDGANAYDGALAYSGTGTVPAKQAGGIDFGSMLRREFVSLVSVRNYNP